MKKTYNIPVLFTILCFGVFSSFNYHSEDFKSVKIGTQTWMVDNLNTGTFRNGDPIPEAKSQEDWIKAGKEKKAAWCYYDNKPENEKKYGKLYNWYAINDPRGLAPTGWHIPIPNEWLMLKNFLGEEVSAKLRSTSGWNENRNGDNSSGFTAYPGGWRSTSSVGFLDAEMYGYWWCSTEDWARPEIYFLCWCGGTLHSRNKPKDEGCSVRCIKD